MKKLFAIIAVALFATTASAQFNFGVKGGLNVSSISLSGSLTDNLKSENQTGFFIGPTVKFTLPVIGLGFDAAALYDQKSSKVSDVNVKQQSIVVPINVRYGFGLGDLASIYVFAGPQFGFNVGDKDTHFDLEDVKGDYKLKDSNLSLNLGLGTVLMKHLQVSANYNIALGKTGEFNGSKITNAWKDSSDAKTNTWQVALAYWF